MTPAQAVYRTMTADYGKRTAAQADNCLDFDGLLHVDAVDRFIDALRAWQEHVHRTNGARAVVRKARLALERAAEKRA